MLHNLRYDEGVMTLYNASGAGTNADLFLTGSAAQAARLAAGGACTHIAFRTGGGAPLMAAGGGAGVITVWNLEQRRLHTLIRDAHDAPLSSLHFFPGAWTRAQVAGRCWLLSLLRCLLAGTARPPARGLTCPPAPYAGEPLLMSAGRDNSLKQWVFDSVDGAARLLRFRSGHAAPPTVVRHYGSGRLLLSAGALRPCSRAQGRYCQRLAGAFP